MSVVGLTFGKAANASRPTTASAARAATTAITLAGGRSRSYQPKPQASATARRASEAACQLTGAPRRAAPRRSPRRLDAEDGGHRRRRRGAPPPPQARAPLRL